MKQLLFLLIFPALINAQGPHITSVSPTTLCPGESLTIKYKMVPNYSTEINLQGSEAKQIWSYDATYLKSKPSQVTGADTIYTMTLTVPGFIGKSIGKIYTASPGSDYMLDMYCGLDVGIDQYRLDAVKPIYRDLNGNVVTPQPNTLLIEQRGIYRRKVIITE